MKHLCLLLAVCSLAALAANSPAQETEANAADLAKRKEQHRKFAEVSAQARQEEAVAKAFEEATKAYQKADLLLLQRIAQIDPSLADYIKQKMRRYHRSAPTRSE
jgi:hypothetical protein